MQALQGIVRTSNGTLSRWRSYEDQFSGVTDGGDELPYSDSGIVGGVDRACDTNERVEDGE